MRVKRARPGASLVIPGMCVCVCVPNDQKGVCVDTRASSKGVIDTRACVLTKGHLSPATAAVTILLYKLF